MWAKNDCDEQARARDFSSLRKNLSSTHSDITSDLAHILGKCARNDQYCKFARLELIKLSHQHERLDESIAIIGEYNSKIKNIFAPDSRKRKRQQAEDWSPSFK